MLYLVTIALCLIVQEQNVGNAITLEMASKAAIDFEASAQPVRSSGSFIRHKQNAGSDRRELWTEGTFDLAHAREKLALDLKFTTRMVRKQSIDRDGNLVGEPEIFNAAPHRVVVISDGNQVSLVTFSSRITQSGCKIEQYSSLHEALQVAQFPLTTPANPAGIVNIKDMIKNFGLNRIDWSHQDGGIYRGSFQLKNNDRVHGYFEVDKNSGNYLVSRKIFNRPSEIPAASDELIWAQTEGVWHVKSVLQERLFGESPGNIGFNEFSQIKFDKYTIEEEIADRVFTLKSLTIPFGTRTLDRR